MSSLLGLHWLREHPDNNRDLAHIEAMQYPSIKLFKNVWDNRETSAAILSVLPRDSYILARDHALSEQKEQMWSKPVEHGIYHANEWANKVQSGIYTLPLDRTFFLGINEPDATDGDRNAIDLYTASFLDRLSIHGLRGGAFNFSTGHPRTVDGTGGSEADYSVFERSHGAIVRGHHIGVLHIYGTGAVPCAPGHFDRLKACTWQDVEWVVGEFGVDEHVIGGGEHAGFHKYFKDRLNDYCGWLDTAIMGVNDPRIHSYQVFTYDFSHPWSSFDVSVIHSALESYQWQHTKQQPPKKPIDTHLPQIGAGAIAYISAPAGLKLRAAPSTSSAELARAPYGTQIRIIGVSDVKNWIKVRYGQLEGYMYSQYISTQEPKPLPVPEPTLPPPPTPVATNILDPLVAQAILQVESGGRTHGENGKVLIRFEAHVFRDRAHDKARVDQFFRFDLVKPWTGQEWRINIEHPWRLIHTGSQQDEYNAFAAAQTVDTKAAYESISMGAPQIMGFHFAKIGYPTAEAMFRSFNNGPMQIVGFLNFCLSTPGLMDAMQAKNWDRVALLYNGSGNVPVYSKLLRDAYESLGG